MRSTKEKKGHIRASTKPTLKKRRSICGANHLITETKILIKKKSYAEILKICLTLKMITLKYNFKSIQKGLYEIVQNAVKMMSQFI